MKILFVVNKLPFPPRDGVTIPTYGFSQGLAQEHEVHLLCFCQPGQEPDRQQLADNKAYVHQVHVAHRFRNPAWQRAWGELCGRTVFPYSYTYDVAAVQKLCALEQFDVVWLSPLELGDVSRHLQELFGQTTLRVAGISDCMTSVYRSACSKDSITGLDAKGKWKAFLRWLRSWPIGRVEARWLSAFDVILVQTETDRQWVDRLFAGRFTAHTHAVSNGTRDELFTIPIPRTTSRLLFFGRLHGVYGDRVEWLLDKVWPRVRAQVPEAEFCVIGRGAAAELLAKIAGTQGVHYVDYVPGLRDVFVDKSVMVAPIFKEYGLINKVVESMAAGVPVVGDSGSFNGIAGLQADQHAIVAHSAESMAAGIVSLLTDVSKREQMAIQARDLVYGSFTWNSRIHQIEEILANARVDKEKMCGTTL